MSVAFRRDCDEEHLEPKFELPIPAGPNLVTARGLALIAQRIAGLEAQLDASDDPAILTAIRRDLRYWNTRQITALVVPVPLGESVEIGTEVTIILKGHRKTFRIVGHDEANPAEGLISLDAPLSQAMLGAVVGEVLAFANVSDAIEIVKVQVAPQ